MVRRGAQAMYNQIDKRGATVIFLGGNVGGARGAAVTSLGGDVGGAQAKLSASKQQKQLCKSYTSNALLQSRTKPISALNGTCVSPTPSLSPPPPLPPQPIPPQGLLLPPLHPVGGGK